MMAGIYIHIPFCRKACTYCNFHFSTSLTQKAALVDALLNELESRKDYLQGGKIHTLYLGGGTPSLLSYDELSRVFDVIARYYDIDALQECTLEANPDDLTGAYLKSLSSTPVNRLSIGVQSFHDADLVYMNRAHSAQQAEYALKAAQDKGFEQLTIDLIYGTPGLSDTGWMENLAKVQSLSIPHFSAYALTVEEGTALHHAIRHKKQVPVDADQSARQMELLMQFAPQFGFEQYEISNFAAGGHYALHNTNYWRGVPYLGIGPSAHSFDGRNRLSNIANNVAYIKACASGDLSEMQETDILSEQDRLNEYMMTSLRTQWGCDLSKIEAEWGKDSVLAIKASSQPFIEKNWLLLRENRLLLTLSGKLFADHIAASLFV